MENFSSLAKGEEILEFLFNCHMSLEASLKAAIAFETKFPPKEHLLNVLAKLSFIGRNLSASQTKFIQIMTPMSTTSRYPEDIDGTIKLYPLSRYKYVLQQTIEIIDLIKNKLDPVPENSPPPSPSSPTMR
ncbi:MAG: HEPN domain-containing protein [Deltaproteobacteria bacterium]|jgi:HEPN domain-containing protein|nr:HEPN domain-containing protein [Deltaproteobacteria bacterium]